MKTTYTRFAAVAALAALGLTAVSCSSEPEVDPAAVDDPELASLVEAAQAEGSVIWYSAVPEAGSEHAAEVFQEKYGIEVELLSLSSAALMQRFATEGEAGAVNADVVVGTNFDRVVTDDFIPNGWLEAIQDSGIPAIDNGDFPGDFIRTSVATLTYIPWVIAYNSSLIDEADVPTSFAELAESEYADMLLTTDPGASAAYIEFWDRIQTEFGPETIQGIAANNPQYFDSAGSASEALAAGEGTLNAPTSVPAISRIMDAGAPVDYITVDVTTGAEMQLAVVPEDVAAHPNAARLFANFLLSPDGNAALAEVGSDVWVLDPSLDTDAILALSPASDAESRRDEILANFGL